MAAASGVGLRRRPVRSDSPAGRGCSFCLTAPSQLPTERRSVRAPNGRGASPSSEIEHASSTGPAASPVPAPPTPPCLLAPLGMSRRQPSLSSVVHLPKARRAARASRCRIRCTSPPSFRPSPSPPLGMPARSRRLAGYAVPAASAGTSGDGTLVGVGAAVLAL
eukprot:scaffold2236_cov136-Isochrysis_galbana.AAC.10